MRAVVSCRLLQVELKCSSEYSIARTATRARIRQLGDKLHKPYSGAPNVFARKGTKSSTKTGEVVWPPRNATKTEIKTTAIGNGKRASNDD